MTLNIDPQLLRWAQSCVSTDRADRRLFLSGILLTTDGKVVATNGHILFVGQDKFSLWADHIVKLYGTIPVSASSAALHVDSFNLKASRLDVWKWDRLGEWRTQYRPLLAEIIEDRYPDWKQAFPNGEPVRLSRIGIAGGYLQKAAKILGNISMEFYGEREPIVCRPLDSNSDAKLIVMPVRVD